MSMRLTAILWALVAMPITAETVVTPATFADALQTAKAGDTLRLAPGSYNRVSVRDRHWSPPVVIAADAARLSSMRFDDVSGITWHGGVFDGGDTVTDGIKFEQGDHVVVDGATFRHYTSVGIILGRVTDARLTNNVFSDSGSDGIDIAMSQRIVADHNRCTDFHPTQGAHPDCIQLWSKANFAPVADVEITNNVAIGDMQGFTAFDGPYDRITVEHNYARVTYYHGIAVFDCRHCSVRHNRVESMPNAVHPEVRAWIKVQGGDAVINCDNRSKDFPDFSGRKRCRRGT